jgi:hypothetical protein
LGYISKDGWPSSSSFLNPQFKLNACFAFEVRLTYCHSADTNIAAFSVAATDQHFFPPVARRTAFSGLFDCGRGLDSLQIEK